MSELQTIWEEGVSWLLWTSNRDDLAKITRLAQAGLRGLNVMSDDEDLVGSTPLPAAIVEKDSLQAGDVVAITPGHPTVQVLYRESDIHHTVFLTGRCNSNCVMCSQPPWRYDDSWLIQEAKEIARHIVRSPATLGFTGGEPLLLGCELRDVLDYYLALHRNTCLEVLTNGRLLSDKALSYKLLSGLSSAVVWMVPLYGHADFLHDSVVRSKGAFAETIDGLLNLRAFSQVVQLRIVLIEPVLRVLPDLCSFISRNLPFVSEVSLMGCEPTGFALANQKECRINPDVWTSELIAGIKNLRAGKLRPIIMNIPLCGLPKELWQFASRSISEWKQVYAPECDACRVREICCGMFASYKRGWLPTKLRPIVES